MSFTITNSPTARRDLTWVVLARSLSLLGDTLALIVLTVRLHESTPVAWAIAALLAAGTIPLVLVAPWAGYLVDRYDSRTLLVCGAGGQVVVCVALATFTSLQATLVLVGLLGAAESVVAATWSALVPRIVDPGQLGRASGRLQAGATVAELAGPALAGILTGLAGTRLPLLVDAATYAFVVVAALALRSRRRPERAARREGRSDWRAGARFLRHDPVLGPMIVGLYALIVVGVMVNVIEIFLVRDTLGGSVAWYGGLVTCWAVGVLGGALLGGRLASNRGRVRAVQVASVVLSLAITGYALAPNVWVVVPLALLGGVANGVLNVGVGAIVMTRTPEEIRGRVAAAMTAGASAASAISLIAGGILAALLTPREIYGFAGLAGLIVVALTGPRALRAAHRPSSPHDVDLEVCA